MNLTKFSCSNKFNAKKVRAAGDWSASPNWNAVEPLGLMTFDESKCIYSVVLFKLRANFQYFWKVRQNKIK